MFIKKDFNMYFDELYKIEKIMEKEATQLLEIIDNDKAKEILKQIVADERRHASIVLSLKEMI